MSNATSPVGAFPPPPGVTPNFEDPRDAGWMLNVVGMSVMAATTTFFFAIRTYVKFSLASPFLPEDCYHAWEITKEAYQEVMRWLYASSIIYIPAAYFTKVTLLLLEARVFTVHERTSRGIRIFIITLLICYIPIQTLKTVICLPISSFWNPRTSNPKCLNQRKIFIADLSLAIITDFIILVLPIPLLWGLRMPLRKKLKILTLLGAGGIATAVTVYRMYLVVQFLTSKDVTADFVVLDLITKRTGVNYNCRALELVIGVVCACLPSTNILYERIRRGETKPKGNLPRTAHDIKQKSLGSSYLWSMMTGKQSKPARTEFTMAEPATSPNYRANFDTELAILTGQPMGTTLPKEELDIEMRQNSDDWVYNPRANSMDGRREGWLAPGAESSVQGFERERVPNWQHHEIEARKSWEAVWERGMPMGGLPSIPEDGGPPRLELTTHPLPDWENLSHG
ncbi:integral membrane protein [Colletotrichum incanum]|nr:integral membrane protein [Colletotrichum incanum]